MNKTEIKAFKNELRNLKFYQERIEELKDEINNIEYKLCGVGAVSAETIPGTTNPDVKSDNYWKLIDKKDKLISKKERYTVIVNDVLEVLQDLRVDVREMCVDIYVNEESFRKIAKRHNISCGALQTRIDAELFNI